jgi:hypothetical protein
MYGKVTVIGVVPVHIFISIQNKSTDVGPALDPGGIANYRPGPKYLLVDEWWIIWTNKDIVIFFLMYLHQGKQIKCRIQHTFERIMQCQMLVNAGETERI